jgi:hypothetical protein
MEKPITRTTFLHDIGLFVEKYLLASSSKAELAHPWSNARRAYMPGMMLNLKTIHSSAYRSGDFWPIQVRGVSKFIENERFR